MIVEFTIVLLLSFTCENGLKKLTDGQGKTKSEFHKKETR